MAPGASPDTVARRGDRIASGSGAAAPRPRPDTRSCNRRPRVGACPIKSKGGNCYNAGIVRPRRTLCIRATLLIRARKQRYALLPPILHNDSDARVFPPVARVHFGGRAREVRRGESQPAVVLCQPGMPQGKKASAIKDAALPDLLGVVFMVYICCVLQPRAACWPRIKNTPNSSHRAMYLCT